MVTLEDFQKYETLENNLRAFIINKCQEYNEAKGFNSDDYYNEEDFERDLEWWEYEACNLKVVFEYKRTEGWYNYYLPLDILFDPDFKEKMRIRFEEEREKQRLALIEKRKANEVELQRLREKKRAQEIEMLKELMGKYPDIVVNPDNF